MSTPEIRFVRTIKDKDELLHTIQWAGNNPLPREGDWVNVRVSEHHTVHSKVERVLWDYTEWYYPTVTIYVL